MVEIFGKKFLGKFFGDWGKHYLVFYLGRLI
jgi:hypothetical protein